MVKNKHYNSTWVKTTNFHRENVETFLHKQTKHSDILFMKRTNPKHVKFVFEGMIFDNLTMCNKT